MRLHKNFMHISTEKVLFRKATEKERECKRYPGKHNKIPPCTPGIFLETFFISEEVSGKAMINHEFRLYIIFLDGLRLLHIVDERKIFRTA